MPVCYCVYRIESTDIMMWICPGTPSSPSSKTEWKGRRARFRKMYGVLLINTYKFAPRILHISDSPNLVVAGIKFQQYGILLINTYDSVAKISTYVPFLYTISPSGYNFSAWTPKATGFLFGNSVTTHPQVHWEESIQTWKNFPEPKATLPENSTKTPIWPSYT